MWFPQIMPMQDAEFAEKILATDIASLTAGDEALARNLAANNGGMDGGLSRMPQPSSFPSDDAMLHVSCEIGEHEIDMLVDTGAQMSVISEQLAAQLGLLSRLDRRFQGMANGVGQAKILGKVWDVPVKLGHVEFSLNFSVLHTNQHIILLGLDLMRQFKCVVDLERNCLVFGGFDGVQVPLVSSAHNVVSSPIDALLAKGRRAADTLRARDASGARTAFRTLGVVLNNIAQHPDEVKYRRLKGSNDRLQRELLAHPEIVELLQLIGFAVDGEDLVLKTGTPLVALRKLIAVGGLLN